MESYLLDTELFRKIDFSESYIFEFEIKKGSDLVFEAWGIDISPSDFIDSYNEKASDVYIAGKCKFIFQNVSKIKYSLWPYRKDDPTMLEEDKEGNPIKFTRESKFNKRYSYTNQSNEVLAFMPKTDNSTSVPLYITGVFISNVGETGYLEMEIFSPDRIYLSMDKKDFVDVDDFLKYPHDHKYKINHMGT